jgi:preprotein translocase subunit SecD
LLVFAAVIAVMYIAVAALGTWKPKLGLDLQGGTRITLEAKAIGGSVTSDKLCQAVDIIKQRVIGAGVANSEVTTQGSNIITVEIPGKVSNDLANTIGETAQLRFRVVAQEFPPSQTQQQQPTTPPPTTPTSPTTTTPGTTPTSSGSTKPNVNPPPTTPTKKRVAPRALDGPPLASSGKPKGPAATKTATPLTPPATAPASKGRHYSVIPPAPLEPPNLVHISDPWSWVENPPQDWLQRAATYRCPTPGHAVARQLDVPSQPLIACDDQGFRYLLGPSVVEGTHVTDASAGIPQGQINYAVTLSFDGTGSREFRDATGRTAKSNPTSPNSGDQIAIVLDGRVLSAPVNDDVIPNGEAIITGATSDPFTQSSASSLANALKFGALPLTFSLQDVTEQGPELASGQLDAGILAGIVGLILVVFYCLMYYRGLSIVVVSSLCIAGLITYACVLLLGHSYGFTLTLPEIAGLIVAIGITADSFIVDFERLRDEVRDGKTLRTSVETGWARARMTILAADSVSILAALVLFIFAIGDVKGFAFALGLTTIIDIFVVFFFTKPVVTLLARTRFYGQGHKWSGLDRAHLGMPPLKPKPRTARGEV